MTSQVVTVRPSTPFKEVVEVLRTQRVAVAPVVDELGLVQGVVSEADLLLKLRAPQPDPRLIRLLYRVDGVVHVDARVDWEVDDTRPRAVEFAQLGP